MSTNGETFEQSAQNGIKIATVNSAKTPVRSTVVRSPGNKENQANQEAQQEMVLTLKCLCCLNSKPFTVYILVLPSDFSRLWELQIRLFQTREFKTPIKIKFL